MNEDLTHFRNGRPAMVDVSGKQATVREAVAEGFVRMSPQTLALVSGATPKGDVAQIASLAGITGAKRTADLIPLCHPLPLDKVDVVVTPDQAAPGLKVVATARTTGRTGVEMEALTAVSVACLTIYDMLKAQQKDLVIGPIQLVAKSGGRSGTWQRD